MQVILDNGKVARGVVVVDAVNGIPFDSLAQTIVKSSDGNTTTITVSYGGNSYVQTIVISGLTTTISKWVKQ